LPTPSAGNFNDGESPESWEARRQRNLAKGINGNGQGTPLAMAVRLLPTPTARDVKGPETGNQQGGQHLPGAARDLALLPTPQARDGDHSSRSMSRATAERRYAQGKRNLDDGIALLLPTPTASDRFGAGDHGEGGPDLRTTIALLPTPRASDGEKGGPNQRGSSGDLMLPSAIMALLPTPRAQNGEDRNAKIRERPLDQPQNLENALARLPGDRTGPPSDAGS
jgi:hypothetical protein